MNIGTFNGICSCRHLYGFSYTPSRVQLLVYQQQYERGATGYEKYKGKTVEQMREEDAEAVVKEWNRINGHVGPYHTESGDGYNGKDEFFNTLYPNKKRPLLPCTALTVKGQEGAEEGLRRCGFRLIHEYIGYHATVCKLWLWVDPESSDAKKLAEFHEKKEAEEFEKEKIRQDKIAKEEKEREERLRKATQNAGRNKHNSPDASNIGGVRNDVRSAAGGGLDVSPIEDDF